MTLRVFQFAWAATLLARRVDDGAVAVTAAETLGTETDGTYRSRLHTVLADDDWAIAIYRASGRRNGIDLDVDQALVIRCEDGRWKEVTAVPLDATFDAFWA